MREIQIVTILALLFWWTNSDCDTQYTLPGLTHIQEITAPAPLRSFHKNPKPWTILVYMSADNDLRSFAASNIKQMASIGSNEHVSIVIHLDIRLNAREKITRRYLIEHGRIVCLNCEDPTTQSMDSGSPQTLISFGRWGLQNFPAHHHALIIWNHGTGCLEPMNARMFETSNLFSFNAPPHTVNPNGLPDWIRHNAKLQRGVCWDASTGHHITNTQLASALREITNQLPAGKKLDIIGFDTCLMAMIEVAHEIKDYAHIMVGSQEVELGAGWNYAHALAPFKRSAPDPKSVAQAIVRGYENTYKHITSEYTQSALYLDRINEITENVHLVGHLLTGMLSGPNGASVARMIKVSANKFHCTHFDDPNYLDLHHLYQNLLRNLTTLTTPTPEGNQQKEQLRATLTQGINTIRSVVFANVAGKGARGATGISIYLPDNRIHPSYAYSQFAQKNNWYQLLLAMQKHRAF